MSSFSKDHNVQFFSNVLDDYASPEEIHQNFKKELSRLDRELFPTPWVETKWEGLFQDSKEKLLLGSVAEETKLLGSILFSINDPEIAHLQKVLVLPENRREGLGSLMMQSACDILSHHNFKSIFLEVEQSNFEALALYRKWGFKVLVSKKDFYGPLRDAWAMELRF